MAESKISHYAIKKVFIKHKHKFPKGLTKIYAIKNDDGSMSLQFLCDESDVTSQFFLDKELYGYFIDAFGKIKHTLETNKQYFYNAPELNKGEKIMVDSNTLQKLRMKKDIPVSDLAKHANISWSTIYVLERGEPIDISLSTIINYSLFFKYPIHNLLMPSYKKEMLKIVLNDMMIKGYIDEGKAKEIFEKETKV